MHLIKKKKALAGIPELLIGVIGPLPTWHFDMFSCYPIPSGQL